MLEDIILIKISNKACLTYFFRGGGGGGLGIKLFDLKEGLKIMPHYPFQKFIMIYLFRSLIPALKNLNKNICFLDIDEKYDNIKISCDWCSICNGIMNTVKQNIIKNPKLLKEIDYEKLKIFNNYVDFILIDRTKKITDKQIEKWCNKTFKKIINDKNINNLLLLSQLYLKAESIELRWCPFKRSKEFYYRNKDKRYLEPTEKMIYEVGKILSKYETMKCNNCPKVVNANWKYTKSNEKSIFQPLLNYMMEEINKYEI
jgi:hypothetical protein